MFESRPLRHFDFVVGIFLTLCYTIFMDTVKPKVLLIEDDPFMIGLLSDEFSRNDFEVLLAGNGDEALKQFQAGKPDAMVVDIFLPKKNGIEVLRDIRALPEGKDVPAIVLSNLEESAYVNEAEKLGVKAYLIKANVQLPEIVAKVKEILGK